MNLTLEEQILANVILQDLIEKRTPVSYSDFSSLLGLSGPQKINRIVKWLEQITLEDAHAGNPLRASMIFSKQTPGLPSPGFFLFCKKIGLIECQNKSSVAQEFIESQKSKLFSMRKVYE